MGKKDQRRFNLQDYKAGKEEEGAVYIDAGDRTFRVPPPLLWDDDVTELATAGKTKQVAVALLGEDDYRAFVEAGGTGSLLLSMVNDAMGTGLGESSGSAGS